MQGVLTISFHLMSVKQLSPVFQADSSLLLSWSFNRQLTAIQYLNILKDQYSASSRNDLLKRLTFHVLFDQSHVSRNIWLCVAMNRQWFVRWAEQMIIISFLMGKTRLTISSCLTQLCSLMKKSHNLCTHIGTFCPQWVWNKLGKLMSPIQHVCSTCISKHWKTELYQITWQNMCQQLSRLGKQWGNIL